MAETVCAIFPHLEFVRFRPRKRPQLNLHIKKELLKPRLWSNANPRRVPLGSLIAQLRGARTPVVQDFLLQAHSPGRQDHNEWRTTPRLAH